MATTLTYISRSDPEVLSLEVVDLLEGQALDVNQVLDLCEAHSEVAEAVSAQRYYENKYLNGCYPISEVRPEVVDVIVDRLPLFITQILLQSSVKKSVYQTFSQLSSI